MIDQDKYLEDVDARTQLQMLEGLAETLNTSVMITTADSDRNPTILYVNDAFTRLTGYTFEEAVGKTPKILQGKRTEAPVLQQLREDLAKYDRFHGRTYNYRKGGSEFLMDWEIVPFGDAAGHKRFYFTVQRSA